MKKHGKTNIEDIIGLTPMQEGMLFHYLQDTAGDFYFEQLSIRLHGVIDRAIFEKAWNFVIDTNEMLHTCFHWEKMEHPLQLVLKEYQLNLTYYDLSRGEKNDYQTEGAIEKLLQKIKKEDRSRKFDLRQTPHRITLCKLSEHTHEMIISNHHILYDGWSNGVILLEFLDAYDALQKGQELVKPGKTKFKEYVKWLKNQDRTRQKEFWQAYLQGFDTITGIPGKRAQEKEKRTPRIFKITLQKDTQENLAALAGREKITLSHLFYSAYGVLLQKYNNTDDVVFGATIHGRSAKIKDIENVVGLFINTLPIRIKTAPPDQVHDLLQEIDNAVKAREEFESTPLVNIKECINLVAHEELFDSIVVVENYPLDSRLKQAKGRLKIDSYSMFEMTNYDLTVAITLADTIEISFLYNDESYEQETIERLADHYTLMLEAICRDPGKRINEIELLSPAEKNRILFDFNQKESDFTPTKTIPRLFAGQVERTPDSIALVGSHKSNTHTVSLTYRKLDEISGLLAFHILEKGTQTGQLLGIKTGRTLEMIIGILGILKTGCGYVPLNPKAPHLRNDYILEECRVKMLLTERSIAEACKGEPRISPEITTGIHDIAYVIFTSGSTGNPKGVLISHANFCSLVFWGYSHIKLSTRDKVVQNLPYYFDWSVWEIFITLTTGAGLYMAAEETILTSERYVDFIERNNITMLHITPTQFQSLIESNRRFGSMKHLAIGAEKLTLDLVRRAYTLVNEDCIVYNMYGPTEATIMAAVLDIVKENDNFYSKLSSIPIGPPIAANSFFILDKDLNVCPLEITGELYIGGDSLARGYLNNPELTAEKFVSGMQGAFLKNRPLHPQKTFNKSFWRSRNLFSKRFLVAEGNYLYKTGDLVRWLPDGSVEYAGRIDQQVKIRGFRIELAEIENQLLKHEAVKDVVVINKESQTGDKYLCAYVVPGKTAAPGHELREYLAQTLPDYMVPHYFVEIEKIPLNPNGKVDIKALPEPDISAGAREFVAPQDEIEKKLAHIWQDVLSISTPVGIHDNFFEYGGHSLKAARLTARIHKEFDVEIPLPEVFKAPTVKTQADYLKQKEKSKYADIKPAAEKEYYAPSPAQKRLYILQQMDKNSTAYNMPGMMSVQGKIEIEKFKAAFIGLIERHEILRTSFAVIDEEPLQKIHSPEQIEFEIEYYTPPNGELPRASQDAFCAQTIAAFIRPFDLSRAPLLRAGLLKLAQEKHLLMIDMHHTISDGASMVILIKEFASLFKAEALTPLPCRYRDYVEWLQAEQQKETIKKQENFWLHELAGEIPVLQLPCDYPRPPVQTFSGDNIDFAIDAAQTARLKSLAIQENVTLYMSLLAIFNILLSRITGQEDIIIGTPMLGRRHIDLAPLVGMFVNTLVLRNSTTGEKKVVDFLKEVGERTAQAFENQDYQFEDLVGKVAVKRDASRNPLFDAAFAMLEGDIPPIELPGLTLTPYDYKPGTAKFDLTFNCEERSETLAFTGEYNTSLFMRTTIEKFIAYFKKTITEIIKNREIKIGEIEVLPEAEKNKILYDFNLTGKEYPADKTIHRLFADQAARTPQNTAVVFAGEELTYEELNKKADRIAHSLLNQGVRPGSLVGIMVDRSIEMITGILGILKTGGGYVPLNPRAPQERSKYMLAECGVELLLAGSDLPGLGVKTLFIEEIEKLCLEKSWSESVVYSPVSESGVDEPEVRPSVLHGSAVDLAYVIFTSGSTGKPKGVPIAHANFCPLMYWGYEILGIGPHDRTIQNLAYYFDWSVWEIFITLTTGAGLYMAADETLLNPQACIDFISENKITILHVTPTQYSYIAGQGTKLDTLKYLFIGAEKFSYDLTERSFAQVNETCRVFNMYGPTEATIISAMLEIDSREYKKYKRLSSVPIGKPSAGLRLFVLDKHWQLCPVNVPGDLYIFGGGVAHGYLNNPELTAEKFVASGGQGAFFEKIAPWTPKKAFDEPCLGRRSPLTTHLYKTGDIARWLTDGNIEFLGRQDQQVKIRGFRIEPGEIENRLREHDNIEEAVVLDFDRGQGEKYLCAYLVGENISSQEIKEYLSRSLPDYMIPHHFIFIDRIPLNPNGKVDRTALPLPETTAAQRIYTPPRNQSEKKLVEMWSHVLDISPDRLGIDTDFFEIGGQSLKATTLAAKIHKEFSVDIKLTEIFRLPTIRELAAYLTSAAKDEFVHLKPVEEKKFYPQSSAQERLFLLHRIDPGTGYNIPAFVELQGELDKNKLTDIFLKLIARHESLRTSFYMANGEPVQQIHSPREIVFEIEYYEIEREQQAQSIIQEFVKPFDIEQPPLFRAGLIKLVPPETLPQETRPPTLHILMLDMHHIISDGTSMRVFVEDFISFYKGETCPHQAIRYRDFAAWQAHREEQPVRKQQEEYWLGGLRGEIPVINLPTDYARPTRQSSAGNTIHFEIAQEETGALKRLAYEHDATLYMILLALFDILLAKLSGQEDIIIGTPTAGRRLPDFERIIGMFVNTLVLRNECPGEETFIDFFHDVRDNTLLAFENQDYQFEDLVENAAASIKRDIGRNPIFDVMFILQNVGLPRIEIPGLKLAPHTYSSRIAKFDITLTCEEVENRIDCSLEYCTKLFKEETIARIIGYFKNIINSALENNLTTLADIEMISPQEKKQLLFDFNGTIKEYPADRRIHELFAEQAAGFPDNIALISQGRKEITYRELDSQSDRLADSLTRKGLKPGDIAAVIAERTIETVIVIFAVLKAQSAYLPIDPLYPDERKSYILRDSDAKFMLTPHDLYREICSGETQPPGRRVAPGSANLAYIIYTSGSTGQPKGVVVEHRSAVNILIALQEAYPLAAHDTYLLKTSFLFDVSVTELFGWFFAGGRLAILEPGSEKDPQAIISAIAEFTVTHINFVPSMFNLFVDALDSQNIGKLAGLKYLFLAGEAIMPEAIHKFRKLNKTITLENIYGPTEGTVYSSSYSLSHWLGEGSIPIGKPMPNIRLYILDKYYRLAPTGVPGELCIAGSGLAGGYLNRPELTAEKFVFFNRSYKSYMSYFSNKLYKTGDLCRWLPDGNIEYLGRIDYQVKVRGFRVELGEIESKLLKHEIVKEAVVIAREKENDGGERFLCAYFVPNGKDTADIFHRWQQANDALDVSRLRDYLRHALPGYMIPSYFIPVPEIPLTPTGKIDRQKLPHPDSIGRRLERTYTAPSTGLEESIVAIWAETLKLDRVGVDDNFFDLGGTSLDLIRVSSKLSSLVQRNVPVVHLFTYPTVQSLARYLDREQTPETHELEKIAQLKKLDQSRDKKKQAAARMRRKTSFSESDYE